MSSLGPSADGVGVVDIGRARVCETEDHAPPAESEFSELYERLFPQVYPFVRTQVASAEVAQELVSRIFLKACRHWPTGPRGDSATYWIFRIARNTLIDYWRVEGKRAAVSVSLDELAEMSDGRADPEAVCSTKQRHRLLLQVIGTLGHDDRMLLSLKFAGQRSNHDIAEILGASEAAISMRLMRALRRLRQRLGQVGVS